MSAQWKEYSVISPAIRMETKLTVVIIKEYQRYWLRAKFCVTFLSHVNINTIGYLAVVNDYQECGFWRNGQLLITYSVCERLWIKMGVQCDITLSIHTFKKI
jgi:hypothetical protein